MDILKILADNGIEVPQDKQEAVKSAVGKQISKLETERDNYKDSLTAAKETLKSFEGVNVAELQNKVAQLTTDLANKESEYNQKIADRDFNDLVSRFAGEYKAHDVKAVMPFLDVEKLKASKNQSEDVKVAFEALKKDSGFLFEDKTAPRVVSSTSGNTPQNDSAQTQANEALRSLFGKE